MAQAPRASSSWRRVALSPHGGLSTALLLSFASVGCDDDTRCPEGYICVPEGGGGNGPGGSGGDGGQGGGGGGPPAECDPRISNEIADTCGLFVDSSATGAETGTKAQPYQSLAAAVAAPSGGRIYVCMAPLAEAVALESDRDLFGGLDCGGWAPTTEKTPWTASANAVPLSLGSEAHGTLVYGFEITSANASGFDASTLHGNSSIGVVVNGATATFEHVDIIAGQGAAGGDGEDIAGQAPGRQSDAAAFDGNSGGACGMPAGEAQTFSCSGVLTQGGAGGVGGLLTGSGGTAGAPNPGLGEPDGTPGNGDTGVVGWDCGTDEGNGQIGHAGPTGVPGTAGTNLGTISPTTLYAGASGGPGAIGTVGQGGGGGGGRRGNSQNGCAAGQTGPSGGSGGAGGCGGTGGGGGGAGGASIALLSLNASVTLVDVRLDASAGGDGGDGGDGQFGGIGGVGGLGGTFACRGGDGGQGGLGGAGGGGRGGPSLGIAYLGTEPDLSDDAITVAAQPSQGGAGGNGGSQGNGGASGALAKKQSFR